jgi:DNA invertase Pin-like site-specific DNA recombinase
MNNNKPNQLHPLISPDHLRRKAVVYCRQSTEQQVLHNTGSTEYQRSLAEVARAHGWQDSQIEIIDEDLGRSGSSVEGRTGWQRLQDMIDANKVGIVFAANISRLSRQLHDFEVFRMRAALHKTLLYSDGRLSDPTNSNDTIVSQITAMVASFENRKRTEVMMQSRLAKARRGQAVSRLPVGWIKGADGKYSFDPVARDKIQMVIQTFRQTRSVRQTVKALVKAGVEIPSRKRGQQIQFTKPTIGRVTFILTDPAYAGVYVYGKTKSEPGGPVLARGQTRSSKVSPDRWIKIPDHHPAYLSLEEQEEIKSILAKNHFKRRYRVGRGRALTQGLLRCAICGASMTVSYPSKGYNFRCHKSDKYGGKPCLSFSSCDLDDCILREVFKVLRTPSIELLKSALAAARKNKQTRLSYIESERERLTHEEGVARERADLARGKLPSVYYDALQTLDNVLQQRAELERKVASELTAAKDESDKDLEELCRMASDVPALWHHEAVTHQERKEIIRCLIDHIVVTATNERIDATIVWKTDARTALSVWRFHGRHHLIRELHAQNLTAPEIREHLAAGKTSTGQVIDLSLETLYSIMHGMGVKQHRFSREYLLVRTKAAELYREGRSAGWIAVHFREQGFRSASGNQWTTLMVYGLLRASGEKLDSIEDIYRRLITDALARGLSHSDIALKFNRKQIRRTGRPVWTERNVAKACRELNLVNSSGKQPPPFTIGDRQKKVAG